MKKYVAIEINCDGNLCGDCHHKFKSRSDMGGRWVCNLFRTENDDGHTGTCLNNKDKKPIRCRQCQDRELIADKWAKK